MKMRVKHYHKVSAVVSPEGKAELRKGNIIASVATIETDDEVVCVGVARCNPCEYESGVPLRKIGKSIACQRAKDHLLYEAGMLDTGDLRNHESLREKGLVLTMSRDEFYKGFIEGNPFTGRSYILDQSSFD